MDTPTILPGVRKTVRPQSRMLTPAINVNRNDNVSIRKSVVYLSAASYNELGRWRLLEDFIAQYYSVTA